MRGPTDAVFRKHTNGHGHVKRVQLKYKINLTITTQTFWPAITYGITLVVVVVCVNNCNSVENINYSETADVNTATTIRILMAAEISSAIIYAAVMGRVLCKRLSKT